MIRLNAKGTQVTLFNERGLLQSTAGDVFKEPYQIGSDLCTVFPLLGSLLPTLVELTISDAPFHIDAVEGSVLQDGIYDLSFERVPINGELLIMWVIHERSEYYTKLRKAQQRYNEEEILRQQKGESS